MDVDVVLFRPAVESQRVAEDPHVGGRGGPQAPEEERRETDVEDERHGEYAAFVRGGVGVDVEDVDVLLGEGGEVGGEGGGGRGEWVAGWDGGLKG